MSVEPRRPSRRQVLKGAVVLGGLGTLATVGGVAVWHWTGSPEGTPVPPLAPGERPSLEALADAVTAGGTGKDGIPSIDRPRFVPAGDASFLGDDQPVFGLIHRGEVRAYPQLVLVWHEIVNDTVAGERLTVTYCPLTGTVIGFTGVPGGPELTFGTTGNLVNSNLLMYDRQTNSEWPQILGTAIRGRHKGRRLGTVPLVWSTWKAWREKHPDTQVLSTNTGSLRRYGSDPYGSYPGRSGYYFEGGPFFPVLVSDGRFPPKDIVIGVRGGAATVAVHRDLVRREKSVPVSLAGERLSVVWDETLETARVVGGEGRVDALDAMWFSWYAFYPDTEVLR
ncbi:hypothetical protein GCM10012275_22560 [Longimycelium tulufanense]|uniref:DUF3179 domain-containing protein n=1 Tax=Longimycelium tulufanense TaxID=907463 RepID=A0A8J3CDB4_9PSEU|nr:DUF3179 domain-containing protein [Longimycelium tulufanense]GGM51123.1 hypothetical protein GCM10012275_22560 [Longimycelium tulufanense]